jgi:hypothetical protein
VQRSRSQSAMSSQRLFRTHQAMNLQPADGNGTLDSFERKRDAEQARVTGALVKLYEDESSWYAGGKIRNWRPYSEVKAEQEETEARRRRAMAAETLSTLGVDSITFA